MIEEEIIDIIEEILQDPFIYFSQDSSYESVQIRANAIEELLKKYKQQQKEIEELEEEIEELKEEIKRQGNAREIEEEFIEKNYISKDRVKEALGFEKDMAEILSVKEDMTEEQILSYIDTLVSENNRLEDIEDRKVQVAVDFIENKRDKYWRDKIKVKIKELEGMELTEGDIFFQMRDYAVLILKELGVVK